MFWDCKLEGWAESPVPTRPANVPVTSVVPLKRPVAVSKKIAGQELEIRLKEIGGKPPVVCIN
jgi:hypothetical protein